MGKLSSVLAKNYEKTGLPCNNSHFSEVTSIVEHVKMRLLLLLPDKHLRARNSRTQLRHK